MNVDIDVTCIVDYANLMGAKSGDALPVADTDNKVNVKDLILRLM